MNSNLAETTTIYNESNQQQRGVARPNVIKPSYRVLLHRYAQEERDITQLKRDELAALTLAYLDSNKVSGVDVTIPGKVVQRILSKHRHITILESLLASQKLEEEISNCIIESIDHKISEALDEKIERILEEKQDPRYRHTDQELTIFSDEQERIRDIQQVCKGGQLG